MAGPRGGGDRACAAPKTAATGRARRRFAGLHAWAFGVRCGPTRRASDGVAMRTCHWASPCKWGSTNCFGLCRAQPTHLSQVATTKMGTPPHGVGAVQVGVPLEAPGGQLRQQQQDDLEEPVAEGVEQQVEHVGGQQGSRPKRPTHHVLRQRPP